MSNGDILYAEDKGMHVLRFLGDIRLTLGPALEQYLNKAVTSPQFKNVVIDLSDTQGIDSTSLGILAKLAIRLKKEKSMMPVIISINQNINKILLGMGLDKIFLMVKKHDMQLLPSDQLPDCDSSQQEIKEKVLDAHKVLMGLNKENALEFKQLVETIANQSADS